MKLVQWEQNKGKCGVCGDAYNLENPRPHEAGGMFAKGIISKFYAQNQVSMHSHKSDNEKVFSWQRKKIIFIIKKLYFFINIPGY